MKKTEKIVKFYAVQCKLDDTPEKILGVASSEEKARVLLPKEPFPGFNYSIWRETNGEFDGVINLTPSVRLNPNFF